jgi:hypothetical protein
VRRSRPSLNGHLRSILPLRRHLAREQLTCGLPCERPNERSQGLAQDARELAEDAFHGALGDAAALEIGS